MEETNIQAVQNTDKQLRTIDLGKLFKEIKQQWKRIGGICLAVAVLSSAFIVCIPRTFTTVTRMAPEMDSSGGAGAISSLASSFGFDLGDAAASTDAISPLLYPNLMDDNGFVSQLFDIHVESADGTIKTTYYDFLAHHQKKAWWDFIFEKINELLPKDEPADIKSNGKFNPYQLSKKENKIMKMVRDDVMIDYDKQTSVISIEVTAQDRLICKQVADSVRARLQTFITEYRTRKARQDFDYYTKLTNQAKAEYEKARRAYGGFGDANADIVLPSYQAKQEDLENDMQLKYNAYTAISTQLQAARAKVQERTPAFTPIQGAEVPIKPTGPKRMIFVAAMTILAFLFSSMYAGRKVLFSNIS